MIDRELITFHGQILNKNKFYVDDVKVSGELYYKIKKKCEEERKIIEENQQLKENNMSMQEEMVRTWEKIDLYKEVIEEVREKIKTCYFKIDNHSDKYNSFSLYLKLKDTNTGEELLQILDKVKGEDNE